MNNEKKDYHIFGGSKFIESMRSGGYNDTSYAVGEIVDNAIDAGAKHVEILCQDKMNYSNNRKTLDKIAILDDGHGMNSEELRNALLFGDGTRGSNPKDMGKYGMGLPNSSLSQCKRVDVYSWTNDSNPICCHIDVDEVKSGKKEIPIPEPAEIPKAWLEVAEKFSKHSGTLVVWSKLDRCSWSTSKKILEHSTFLIGRIYRKFLAQKDITIKLTRFMVDDNDEITEKDSDDMKPNDPMYLIVPSSTPGKWGKEAMFKPDTTPSRVYKIEHDEKKHEIIVRYSLEKDELRDPENIGAQGNKDYGQHARKNQGISIIRADREIMLDSFGMPIDTRDRWWGVEIDIPPSLDVAVGLTNNKQQMDVLSSIMRTISHFDEDPHNPKDSEDELSQHDKTRKDLFVMVREIYAQIRSMQKRIRATRANTLKGKTKSELDKKIDSAIKKDREEGKISHSDLDRENKKKEERIEEISDSYMDEGMSKEEANKRAKELIDADTKMNFEYAELDGGTFFSPQNTGGILRVKINSKHRIYHNLLLLTDAAEHKDLTDKQKLELIKHGLQLVLMSWARFEDLTENDKRKEDIQNMRIDWGRELNTFLKQNEY